MTDVDDAETLGAQPADQGEQPVHVRALEAARRLVHQEDATVGRQRAADLHDLLRGNRQFPDDAVRPQLRVREVLDQRARAGVGRGGIDDTPAGRLAAHEDVFRHCHVRAERQFLVNEGDAVTARVEWGRRAVRPAVDLDGARIRRERASQHVHERALPRPVLADECVNLPRFELEAHPVERHGGAEPLLDSVDVEKRHQGIM